MIYDTGKLPLRESGDLVARRTKAEALETRNRLLDGVELLFHAGSVSQAMLQQTAHQAGAMARDLSTLQGQDRSFQRVDGAASSRSGRPQGRGPRQRRVIERDRGGPGLRAAPHDHRPAGAPHVQHGDPQGRIHPCMASVQQRRLEARNACVVHFEKALRLAACRPQQAAGAQRRGDARAACADQRTDPTLAARPHVFDLVATGQRTFRMYLVVSGLCRSMRGSSGPGKMRIEINSVFEFGPDIPSPRASNSWPISRA
jgi:TetR/AcrR family acrAB operon transcriptional repressor